ncbi:uncharacterized [Tachysurus ichikawai]
MSDYYTWDIRYDTVLVVQYQINCTTHHKRIESHDGREAEEWGKGWEKWTEGGSRASRLLQPLEASDWWMKMSDVSSAGIESREEAQRRRRRKPAPF